MGTRAVFTMHIVISKNTYRRRSCAAFSPAIPVVGFSAPSSRPPSLDRLFELLGCAAIAAAPIKCSQVEGVPVDSRFVFFQKKEEEARGLWTFQTIVHVYEEPLKWERVHSSRREEKKERDVLHFTKMLGRSARVQESVFFSFFHFYVCVLVCRRKRSLTF